VEHSNLDESSIELNDPLELVQTLAAKKAEIVASNHTNSLVLGCDSLLMVNGEIYGKPDSEAEAIARWQNMRGNMGLLYTGHTLIDQVQQQNLIRCE
jgi:septum formation protein